MYVVVVYDADDVERKIIRRALKPRLHWIQNSVFAGELTMTAAEDLFDELGNIVDRARINFWLFERKPETRRIGDQDDEESMFV